MNYSREKYLKIEQNGRVLKKGSCINKIEMRFRTLHPGGIILMMKGGYGESMALELFQGRIRYSMCLQAYSHYNCHRKVVNKELNDNKWHALFLVRRNRLVELQVDDQIKTIINPLSLDRITFNDVLYLGGYEIDNKTMLGNLLPGQVTFSGCLQITEIDNQNPVLDQKSYKLKKLKFLPHGNVQLGGCDHGIEEFSAVEFHKPTSFLELPLFNTGCSKMFAIGFAIRTFTIDGYIFQTKRSGSTIQLYLESGNLKIVELKGLVEKVSLKSTQKISDGFWHDVYIRIEGARIILQVEGQVKKYIDIQNDVREKCFDAGKIMFGSARHSTIKDRRHGFVGCLRKVHINDASDEISLTSLERNFLRNGVRRGCTLRNKCFPNPCINNGICSQTWKEIFCNCSRTNFIGKRCEKTIYQISCTQYKEFGLNTTSFCLIDGDGEGAMKPHTVLCQVDELHEVYTVVNHNKMENFSATVGEETFHQYTFHKFKYELDSISIQLLIKNSRSCRQKVTFHCYNATIFNAPNGPSNVGWKAWHGNLRNTWGSTGGIAGCTCGQTNSCINRNKLCNCDSYNNKWAMDTGYITNKTELPMRRIHVTGINSGRAYFAIGPLECLHDSREEDKIITKHYGKKILSQACVKTSSQRRIIESAIQAISELKYIPKATTTNSPVTERDKNPNDQDEDGKGSLSTLEIIFLTIACLLTAFVVVKFVFCGVCKKLNGQVVLNQDRERIPHEQQPPHFRKPEHSVYTPDKQSGVFLLTPEKNAFSDLKEERPPTPSNFWV